MSLPWNADQVLAFAPDSSSASAAQGLASIHKWATLGRSDEALWGECRGSGAKPYQTRVHLVGPAYKCSCPSRKFPCKHALGLMLLTAQTADAVAMADLPEWVETWLATRRTRAESAVEKAEAGGTKSKAPTDPLAATKRAAQREARVRQGVDDLERWLCDVVREGIANVPHKGYGFFDGPAARLVDAQAGGLARQVRSLADIAASGASGASSTAGDRWPDRLLARLGKLMLAADAFRRLDALPDGLQADVRGVVGFTQSQDEVLAGEGLRDVWACVAQRVDDEGTLITTRSWLRGEKTGRVALHLHFAHPTQRSAAPLLPLTATDASLAFFPSALPLRALIKEQHATRPLTELPAFDSFADALGEYAASLAANPWTSPWLLSVSNLTLIARGDGHVLIDTEGRFVPLHPAPPAADLLLAISGGHRFTLAGEFNGETIWPLTVGADSRVHDLPSLTALRSA